MALTADQKKTRKKIREIFSQTKSSMEAIGTYHSEFDPVVQRYAAMRYQFELMNEKWCAEGCKITEEYTNKAGATNVRKTALYLALEGLRKDLLVLENTLGLTPKGLKSINSKQVAAKGGSALEAALIKLDG